MAYGPGLEKTTFHGTPSNNDLVMTVSIPNVTSFLLSLIGAARTAGKAERDYAGRTYMSVPTDIDVNLLGEPGTQECFIPKRHIHTWSGHTKGVNAIRFFPKTAHLLLSCSMDTKVKIWDVYHDRRVLRTYMGHTKGVRDICFNNDGTRFLSAGFDKFVKLWDTETGTFRAALGLRSVVELIFFRLDNVPICGWATVA